MIPKKEVKNMLYSYSDETIALAKHLSGIDYEDKDEKIWSEYNVNALRHMQKQLETSERLLESGDYIVLNDVDRDYELNNYTHNGEFGDAPDGVIAGKILAPYDGKEIFTEVNKERYYVYRQK